MRTMSAIAAIFMLAAASPAFAEHYAATSVEIREAAANVRIIPEDRADISVEIAAGSRVRSPEVRAARGHVVIDGNIRTRMCTDRGVRVEGVGNVPRSDLPTITIRTPRAVNFTSAGAVWADIGASAGGDMVFRGCGDAIVAQSSGDLSVTLAGSGDVDVADVAGTMTARLEGSGNLRGRGAQGAHLELAGSGNLSMGAVRGDLDANLAGSGNLTVASVTAPKAALNVAGSGGLRVDGGQAERLEARVAGSGGIRFGGRAGVLDANLAGSGNIRVGAADRIESIRDAGSGSVQIGR